MDTIPQMNGLTLFDSVDIISGAEATRLSEDEQRELNFLENRMEQALDFATAASITLSTCLKAIHDKKLYKAYGSFDNYCRERWQRGRRWGYQLIEAARTIDNLTQSESVRNCAQIAPTNEAQVRPLTALEPEAQREVWAKAVETAPNGKVTAAHVQNVVEEYRKPERPHVSYNSGNNEWYTPKEYVEAARFVLGAIDLDPASSQAANEVVRASVFYTVEDDGLSRDWRGRVWMNPPYSEDLIGKFSSKLADHFAAGDVTAAIVLVNNATETRWFRRLIEVASAVVFPSSRVRFWRPDGKTAGPLQGQALIYMGEHPQKFREGFGSFGWGATL